MRKTIGISRNKLVILTELRRERKQQQFQSDYKQSNRFSKQRLAGQIDIEMSTQMESMKKPFIEELATNSTIENSKPQWMMHFEQCQATLRTVQQLKKEMLMCQNKRLTCIKVSDQKMYEMKIYQCAREATIRIKKCQKMLGIIKQDGENDTPASERVCKSISFKLANDIQELTKQLRSQQRSFVEQRKQFEATQKVSFLELAADHALNTGGQFLQGDLIEDEAMLDLQQRNEQIKNIVKSIYELNDIYKELNQMVILQGSILDRIDENIQASRKAVEGGRQHLVKAEKYQKKAGRCACGTILVLMVAISIMLIVLLSRWFK